MGHYAFIAWVVGAEVVAWALMLADMLIAYRPLQKRLAATSPTPWRLQTWAAWSDPDGEVHARHVFRAIEIVVVLYHLPIVAAATAIRRGRECPQWAYLGVTPILYGLIWWLFHGRGH